MQLVTIDDSPRGRRADPPHRTCARRWSRQAGPTTTGRCGSSPRTCRSIGAFKVRGAFNAIGHLDESVRTRGVVAYSSGNHAQAVAYAAAVYGVPAHIVMPEETPEHQGGARPARHGARGRAVRGRASARRSPPKWSEKTGGVLVPPFDHPDIIAGQGTIGLEIAEDLPDGRERADPGQRRRTGIRHRHRDQGAMPARPRLRRRTGAGGGHGGGPSPRTSSGLVDRGPKPDDRRRPAITTVRT